MKPGTKQRIVGTVVLLALALIFLPIIFDGQGSYQSPVSSRIPDVPVISILPEPVQARPVIVADTLPEETIEEDPIVTEPPVAIAGVTETAVDEPAFSREIPTLDASGLPQGWSVRLGSFSDSANADNLISRLQTAGYRAYTRDIGSVEGAMTGVFVGPWLERIKVDEYQQALQAEFSLSGIVVRYELQSL